MEVGSGKCTRTSTSNALDEVRVGQQPWLERDRFGPNADAAEGGHGPEVAVPLLVRAMRAQRAQAGVVPTANCSTRHSAD